MPHGWKLCVQAFHLSSLTCGCYGFLSLRGLAVKGGQAGHSTQSCWRHTVSPSSSLLATASAMPEVLP